MHKSYQHIAEITRTRGLKGEVKLQSSGDLLWRLHTEAPLWIVPPLATGVRETAIISSQGSARADAAWVFLQAVTSREAAVPLLGRYLLADSRDIEPAAVIVASTDALPEGDELSDGDALHNGDKLSDEKTLTSPEFLLALTGRMVNDIYLGEIGVLREIRLNSAQNLLIVESERWGEVLIPAVSAFLRGFDGAALSIEIPEALLELNR